MTTWLTWVLDALFPEVCRRCGGTDAGAPPWVCDRCIDDSPPSPPPACAACGLEVDGDPPPHRGPLVHAATRYDADADAAVPLAIRMLKYDGRRRLARPLATLVHRRTGPRLRGLLVPVPLHPARTRRRGYNQAGLLARHIGRFAGVPVAPMALRRTRETATQARLSRAARLDNLTGAFVASARLGDARPIVLVDDVATTGATLTACAEALRAVGVGQVVAVVVARRVLLSRTPGTR